MSNNGAAPSAIAAAPEGPPRDRLGIPIRGFMGSPVINQEIHNRLLEMTINAFSLRTDLLRRVTDPRRNVYLEVGYPDEETVIPARMYYDLYERESVAARVVEILPQQSWQTQPSVYETEAPDDVTEFETAWRNVGRELRGEESFYQDEIGNPIWEYLARVDKLSGIGRFGVLLLGLDDGLSLDRPVPGISEKGSGPVDVRGGIALNGRYQLITNAEREPGKATDRKLVFLRAFSELEVTINKFEGNPSSRRFGMPVEYGIAFGDTGRVGEASSTRVHWSRVIHVADNRESSEVYGTPRMRPVLNNLLALKKLYAGSGEMYWKGAFPGLAFTTHPGLGGDVEVDQQAVKDMMEKYMNGLERYLVAVGMDVKAMAPQVVDPSPQIAAQIAAICIHFDIPVRIFIGSERGQLASGQDAGKWNRTLMQRQRGYLSPWLIQPFVNRLISVGVLPKPSGYSVDWPDMESQTDDEKATVALKKTQALANYVNGKVNQIMTRHDYLTSVHGYTDTEALSIEENVKAEQLDEALRQAEIQVKSMEAMGLLPDGTPIALAQQAGAAGATATAGKTATPGATQDSLNKQQAQDNQTADGRRKVA